MSSHQQPRRVDLHGLRPTWSYVQYATASCTSGGADRADLYPANPAAREWLRHVESRYWYAPDADDRRFFA